MPGVLHTKRRSRAVLEWLVQSRRSVIADVMCSMKIDTLIPATLSSEDVLEILRDNVRQNPYAFIDDPNTELLMSTSVQDWQVDADLLPWPKLADAFNAYWNMNASREQWRLVLTQKTTKPFAMYANSLRRLHKSRMSIRPSCSVEDVYQLASFLPFVTCCRVVVRT